MLDHPKNDIFIHMDAKTKSYDPSETLKLVKHSRIFHTPRIKVSWGGYSQVEAALILFEAATSQGHYEHYHLLSGADIPIKSQDDIAAFFEAHHRVEFVQFVQGAFSHEHWVRYYYPFQEIKGRKGSIIVRVMAKMCTILQKIFHIHRNKGGQFMKGDQWFSITDEFARYILGKKSWIQKVFGKTIHPEEICIQTLLINSPFRDNLYHKEFDNDHVKGAMRLIDWKRGEHASPYTFRISDLEEIKSSPAMFARKFDEAVDVDIVRKIQELYS